MIMEKKKSGSKRASTEKPQGKYHYNPVNMAGKKADRSDDDREICKEFERERGSIKRPAANK
jgi:hypothetical protein